MDKSCKNFVSRVGRYDGEIGEAGGPSFVVPSSLSNSHLGTGYAVSSSWIHAAKERTYTSVDLERTLPSEIRTRMT